MVRQTIILREDLNLPKGLSEAQVAHLHFETIRQMMLEGFNQDPQVENRDTCIIKVDNEMREWLKAPYTFVHGVPNFESLRYFVTQANTLQVPYTEWRDTVYINVSDTQKIVVKDCVIGIVMLGESDRIKTVIGDLPLLS
jgi:peptidyl-tRNA hydrolase